MHLHKPVTDLKFNVAQLLREETGGRREYTFEENALPLDTDVTLRQLRGSVRFTRVPSGVFASVVVKGAVERACTRCLSPAVQPIALRFQDEFHSRIEVNTGAALPKPDEEDPFFIDETHLVDLGEAIREYALIELPMQTLCRPDCKGLCPNCGADLNSAACGCSNDEGDERFSVLKSLLS